MAKRHLPKRLEIADGLDAKQGLAGAYRHAPFKPEILGILPDIVELMVGGSAPHDKEIAAVPFNAVVAEYGLRRRNTLFQRQRLRVIDPYLIPWASSALFTVIYAYEDLAAMAAQVAHVSTCRYTFDLGKTAPRKISLRQHRRKRPEDVCAVRGDSLQMIWIRAVTDDWA